MQTVSAQIPWSHNIAILEKVKEPYVFDFIPLREDMLERDIEQALVRNDLEKQLPSVEDIQKRIK